MEMIYSIYARKDTPPEHTVKDKHTGSMRVKQSVVAFQGLCQVREDADEFFGGADSQPFESRIMLNPTWRELFNIAKKQQQATKDEHHVFFEDIQDTGKDDFLAHINGAPVRIIRLVLGS